jgi:hypothetical protein
VSHEIGIFALLWCAFASPILAAEPPSLPPSTTQSEVQTATESIVTAYVEAVARTLGEPATSPTIDVRNTPYLAYFDPRALKIVLPYWPPEKESTRTFFFELADGDEAWAEAFFAELFDWFLVAHEMTHWLQTELGLSLDHFTAEAMANDVAVAFHMENAQGEERLLQLDAMLVRALDHLTNPKPDGMETASYFNAFYMVLTQDPWKYGYYQFGLIRDSIARRSDLALEALLMSLLPPAE